MKFERFRTELTGRNTVDRYRELRSLYHGSPYAGQYGRSRRALLISCNKCALVGPSLIPSPFISPLLEQYHVVGCVKSRRGCKFHASPHQASTSCVCPIVGLRDEPRLTFIAPVFWRTTAMRFLWVSDTFCTFISGN